MHKMNELGINQGLMHVASANRDMNYMERTDWGWDTGWEALFHDVGVPDGLPGRVVREYRRLYVVQTDDGALEAEVTGAFRHNHPHTEDYPAVGDWVVLVPVAGEAKGRIHAVLPRRTAFKRPAPGKTAELQVMAANVDTVLLVSGLDGDFNLRRIERYLTMAYDSGANPVIVLNKMDLEPDLAARIRDVEGVAYGVPVHGVSALSGTGLEALGPYCTPGKTLVCLGSSGAGKSSLVNALLGNLVMETGEVRADDSRGRHTTTHRELFPFQGGGLIIDTPGIRELQVSGSGENLETAFEDVEHHAGQCQFRDCTHQGEPGCAVLAAIEEGALDARRLEAYRRLQREIAYTERRLSDNHAYEERKHSKKLGKLYKRIQQEKRDRQ